MRKFIPGFSSGELSPSLWGAIDLELFQRGVKTCKNFIPLPQGGVNKRMGTLDVGLTTNVVAPFGKAVRLVPFQYNVEQTYNLAFTDDNMYVIKDGGYVLVGSSTYNKFPIISTAVGGPNPGEENDLAITITPFFAVQAELERWFNPGLALTINGTDGGPEIEGRTYEVRRFVATYSPFDPHWASTATIYLKNCVTPATAASYSGGHLIPFYRLYTGLGLDVVSKFKFTQSADVLYMSARGLPSKKLVRLAHDNWTFSDVPFTTIASAPANFTITPTAPAGVTVAYAVFAVFRNNLTYKLLRSEYVALENTDSNALLVFPAAGNALAWDHLAAPEGNYTRTGYEIYKRVMVTPTKGEYRFLKEITENTYLDCGVDLPSDTKLLPALSWLVGEPACVDFHQDRLFWANTETEPTAIFASKTGDYENMSYSDPLKADDAFTFRMATRRVNEIRHIVSLQELIILTSGGEFSVNPGNGSAIGPTTIQTRTESYFGASDVRPVVAGDTLIFVQDKGERLRDFGYRYENGAWVGSDLTAAARHLFEGFTIIDMDYQAVPYGVVWVVRNDGTLLSLTYSAGMAAWASHSLKDGVFEGVSVISEGEQDTAYFVVNLGTAEAPVRRVVRTASPYFTAVEGAYFVDCGVSYSGEPVSVLYNFTGYPAGMELVGLLDGFVVTGLTVTAGGAVELPYPCQNAQVGLAIESVLETLPLAIDGGTAKKKNVTRVTARVEKTLGLSIGGLINTLTQVKDRTTESMGQPTQPFTGELDLTIRSQWSREKFVVVKHDGPLPARILNLIPDVEVGG